MMLRSQLAATVVSVGLLAAQGGQTPSERLLAPYGASNFSNLYRQAVDTLFTAYPAYQRGGFTVASKILNDFWRQHPAGTKEWESAYGEGERAARALGVEYGDPPCYAALRMLTECVAWRLKAPGARASAPPIRFTVVLIGHSHGIQPATIQELHEQRGSLVRNTLDPRFRTPGAIINDCFGLLFEYIRAVTDGRLTVETRIVQLPDLDVPMRVFDSPDQPTAELVPGAMDLVWDAVKEDVKASTDWWYVLYPSHRPEQYPGLAQTDFSNGGGIGASGRYTEPVQMGDERVLVTKPPKYQGRIVGPEERFAYFSQVMQHEFFHELYWLYPQFRLEQTSHQWFNRTSWPSDFEGFLEADYYLESLNKRLLPQGKPPLWEALRFASPAGVIGKITAATLIGAYRREPATNGWHEGSITPDASSGLRWTNHAGKSWHLELTPDKRLLTGPENPYFQSPMGKEFRIAFRRGESGEFLPDVVGFWFNNELYTKLADAR